MRPGSHVPDRLFRSVSETDLWVTAVLLFGAGDGITTVLGLQLTGVVETSPLLLQFSEPALYGVMLLLKLGVLGGSYLVYLLVPRPHCIGAPLGLASLGFVVTVWNTAVLTAALA